MERNRLKALLKFLENTGLSEEFSHENVKNVLFKYIRLFDGIICKIFSPLMS